ncbi:MAG: hypothetical protein OXE46_02920 [Chloroflexi bacterium]|nr:hypothetical protein [Chloroflexota bacterium]
MSEPTVTVRIAFEGLAPSAGLAFGVVKALLDHAYKVGGASAMHETAVAIKKAVYQHALPDVDDHPLVEKVKPE